MDTEDICLNNGYKGDIKSFLILSKKNDLFYVTAAPQIQMKNIDSVSIYFNGKNYSLSHMMTVQKKYLGKVIDRIDEARAKEIVSNKTTDSVLNWKRQIYVQANRILNLYPTMTKNQHVLRAVYTIMRNQYGIVFEEEKR